MLPKRVTTFGSVPLASTCGSKIGGSGAPSGVNEARLTVAGARNSIGLLMVSRSSRGTGTVGWFTSTPCQLTGIRRLPALSTAARVSVAAAVQGGTSVKQPAW